MKKIIVSLLLLLTANFTWGQEGYKIDFVVEGLADTTVLLGNFFGESTYVKDTAQVNANGAFSFSGTEKLEPGIYFVVLNKTRLFDFPVNTDQSFKLTTQEPDYVLNMKVEGDIDNKVYFDDLKFNAERNQEAEPYVTVLKDSTSTEEALTEARKAITKINDKVVAHQEEVISANPDAIISKIIKAKKRIQVPAPPG